MRRRAPVVPMHQKLGDLQARGHADSEVKGACMPAMICSMRERNRHAMSHTGNDVTLDQIRACLITPDALRMPSHLADEIGFGGETMNVGPLLADLLRIPRTADGGDKLWRPERRRVRLT